MFILIGIHKCHLRKEHTNLEHQIDDRHVGGGHTQCDTCTAHQMIVVEELHSHGYNKDDIYADDQKTRRAYPESR